MNDFIDRVYERLCMGRKAYGSEHFAKLSHERMAEAEEELADLGAYLQIEMDLAIARGQQQRYEWLKVAQGKAAALWELLGQEAAT